MTEQDKSPEVQRDITTSAANAGELAVRRIRDTGFTPLPDKFDWDNPRPITYPTVEQSAETERLMRIHQPRGVELPDELGLYENDRIISD